MTVSADMTAAAAALLRTFDANQRDAACWSFDDPERRLWFYTPTDHGGLPLSDMGPKQRRLLWRLITTGLSEGGYNTAALIIGQENILDRVEGFGVDFGRDRGRDPQLYWVAIFGEPLAEGTWGWRFGGHHVSLNFVIAQNRVVSTTPLFLGADPAAMPLLGPHLHRPLAAVEDLGRELVRSLDATQTKLSVVSSAPPADLIGVNRAELTEGDHTLPLPLLWRGRFESEIETVLETMQANLEASLGGSPDELAQLAFSTTPKGLSAASMTPDQREVLSELLKTYVGRIHDDLADDQLAKVTGSNLDQLHFLWAGGTEVGDPHYYRIHGGDLFVEHDQAHRGGNHVHTVWRDLSLDFGGDPLADHYTAGSHTH